MPSESKKTDDPQVKIEQEIRLTVVMYGGVSLAIYINGASQELFQLALATALQPNGALLFDDDELRELEEKGYTASIYRQLAKRLRAKQAPLPQEEAGYGKPIHTRFVVDTLSGASAGGINAAYLGKALVCGRQFDSLQRLWIEDADLETLLDHPRSNGMQPSLLQSDKMSQLLIKAFEDLKPLPVKEAKEAEEERKPSGCLNEVDTSITGTDFHGEIAAVELTDRTVKELQHQEVFRFSSLEKHPEAKGGAKHQLPINDYGAAAFAEKDSSDLPLAFAARCTSSFPFAFEAVTEADFRRQAEAMGFAKEDIPARFWQYPRAPIQHEGTPRDIVFSDGGILNNKPFDHAISTLQNRSRYIPLQRKLFYIEPDPVSLEEQRKNQDLGKAHAADVAIAAIAALPRQENIRMDIERVRLYNRSARLLKQTMDRVWQNTTIKDLLDAEIPKGATSDIDLSQRYGMSYIAYHQMRLEHLKHLLTNHVVIGTQLLAPEEILSVPYFVDAWMRLRYSEEGEGLQHEESASQLQSARQAYQEQMEQQDTHVAPPFYQTRPLLHFDLTYRVRRFEHLSWWLHRLISLLSDDPERMRKNLQATDICLPQEAIEELERLSKDKRDKLRSSLVECKQYTLYALTEVRQLERWWFAYGGDGHDQANWDLIHKALKEAFSEIRRELSEERRAQIALDKLREHQDVFHSLNTIGDNIKDIFRETVQPLRNRMGELLGSKAQDQESIEGGLLGDTPQIAAFVWGVYYGYISIDLILFPMMHQGQLREGEPIDMFRISPYDAAHINAVDDLPDPSTNQTDKLVSSFPLSGARYFGFGGFLRKDWRKTDLYRGRLDAATRIAEAIIPTTLSAQDRANELKDLTSQLHNIILQHYVGKEQPVPDTKDFMKQAREELDEGLKDDERQNLVAHISPRAIGVLEHQYEGKSSFWRERAKSIKGYIHLALNVLIGLLLGLAVGLAIYSGSVAKGLAFSAFLMVPAVALGLLRQPMTNTLLTFATKRALEGYITNNDESFKEILKQLPTPKEGKDNKKKETNPPS